MTKIVIDRPPSPIPPLPRTARQWVPQAMWAEKAAERAHEASGSERRGIASKIIGVFAAHGYGRGEQ